MIMGTNEFMEFHFDVAVDPADIEKRMSDLCWKALVNKNAEFSLPITALVTPTAEPRDLEAVYLATLPVNELSSTTRYLGRVIFPDRIPNLPARLRTGSDRERLTHVIKSEVKGTFLAHGVNEAGFIYPYSESFRNGDILDELAGHLALMPFMRYYLDHGSDSLDICGDPLVWHTLNLLNGAEDRYGGPHEPTFINFERWTDNGEPVPFHAREAVDLATFIVSKAIELDCCPCETSLTPTTPPYRIRNLVCTQYLAQLAAKETARPLADVDHESLYRTAYEEFIDDEDLKCALGRGGSKEPLASIIDNSLSRLRLVDEMFEHDNINDFEQNDRPAPNVPPRCYASLIDL